jgi:beta-lactamase class A
MNRVARRSLWFSCAVLMSCAGDLGTVATDVDAGTEDTNDGASVEIRDGVAPQDRESIDAARDAAIDILPVRDVISDMVMDDALVMPRCVGSASDQSETWTCTTSRTERQRCVRGVTETVRCTMGCTTTASGAVCSCGSHTDFTLWNCLASGDLGRCQGNAWEDQSCMGHGCTAMPTGVNDVCRPRVVAGSLQAVLDRLGPTCEIVSPGTHCGIAVRDLATDERATYRGNDRFQSASSAKALWVAAAVLDRGTAVVDPLATPVFRDSDNAAAGSVIDLLSSPARVNTFYRGEAGMTHSSFCRWNYSGITRQASNCIAWSEASNYFTADDAVEFLSRLSTGRIFTAPRLTTMLDWMTRSPRSGSPGGVLGTQLPATARASMRHKAGWIPDLGNHNDIGLIDYAPGRSYAIAILTTGTPANFWLRQSPWIEYASCVIFHGVARDVADPTTPCRRP